MVTPMKSRVVNLLRRQQQRQRLQERQRLRQVLQVQECIQKRRIRNTQRLRTRHGSDRVQAQPMGRIIPWASLHNTPILRLSRLGLAQPPLHPYRRAGSPIWIQILDSIITSTCRLSLRNGSFPKGRPLST